MLNFNEILQNKEIVAGYESYRYNYDIDIEQVDTDIYESLINETIKIYAGHANFQNYSKTDIEQMQPIETVYMFRYKGKKFILMEDVDEQKVLPKGIIAGALFDVYLGFNLILIEKGFINNYINMDPDTKQYMFYKELLAHEATHHIRGSVNYDISYITSKDDLIDVYYEEEQIINKSVGVLLYDTYNKEYKKNKDKYIIGGVSLICSSVENIKIVIDILKRSKINNALRNQILLPLQEKLKLIQ